jgi:hypothetical protein
MLKNQAPNANYVNNTINYKFKHTHEAIVRFMYSYNFSACINILNLKMYFNGENLMKNTGAFNHAEWLHTLRSFRVQQRLKMFSSHSVFLSTATSDQHEKLVLCGEYKALRFCGSEQYHRRHIHDLNVLGTTDLDHSWKHTIDHSILPRRSGCCSWGFVLIRVNCEYKAVRKIFWLRMNITSAGIVISEGFAFLCFCVSYVQYFTIIIWNRRLCYMQVIARHVYFRLCCTRFLYLGFELSLLHIVVLVCLLK